jgi:hypothetical protein
MSILFVNFYLLTFLMTCSKNIFSKITYSKFKVNTNPLYPSRKYLICNKNLEDNIKFFIYVHTQFPLPSIYCYQVKS